MRKMTMRTFAILSIVLLATACQFPLDGPAAVGSSDQQALPIPEDIVNDALRTPDAEFTFKTLFPVSLKLDFALYEPDGSGGYSDVVTSEENPEQIYFTLTDATGNRLFSGSAADSDEIATTVYLPSAPKSINLRISAEGYSARSILLQDMVAYERIERTISLVRVGSDSSVSMSMAGNGIGPMRDADHDGVPDRYDLYPDDPAAAFSMSVPSSESITVAFEDLFGHAAAGDADYNDFIASYGITEVMNAEGLITRIELQAHAVQKLAGYDHSFGIRIDEFEGAAALSGTFINSGGNEARLARRLQAPAEIILFDKTSKAVGKSAYFILEFDTPQHPTIETAPGGTTVLSRPPYNPYLYVHNTRHDIHLIDAEPLSRSINPDDRFVDADGFPWALLVPADWEHPAEGQRIEEAYPQFTDWRLSGGSTDEDWYEHPYDPNDPGETETLLYLSGYINGGTTDIAAYWVEDTSGIQRIDLEQSAYSRATDIAVDGDGSVLVSGFYRDGANRDVAVFWKDGVRSDDLGVNGRATGIAVSDSGEIYISGYYGDTPRRAVYWVVDGAGTDEIVLVEAGNAQATGIALNGSGVAHIAGTYVDSLGVNTVAYWVDSASGLIELSSGPVSNSKGIVVSDGVVYVAGRYYSGGQASAVYWQSGQGAPVILNSSVGQSYAVTVDAGTVYTAGDYIAGSTRRAALWEGGPGGQIDLMGENPDWATFAYDLDIAGGTVYTAGAQSGAAGYEAGYWSGADFKLLEDGMTSQATALEVIVR